MTVEEMDAYERAKDEIVRKAMTAADRILLDGCCGNPEVLLHLTAEVSKEFALKWHQMTVSEIWKKKMICEVEPEILRLGEMVDREIIGETPWVVFSCKTGRATCLRCEEQLNMQLPQPISIFAAATEAFRKIHARCHEKVFEKTMDDASEENVTH